MNTQTLDLNKMQLAPMTSLEMQQTDGGNPISWAIEGILYLWDHRADLPPSPKPGGFVGGV